MLLVAAPDLGRRVAPLGCASARSISAAALHNPDTKGLVHLTGGSGTPSERELLSSPLASQVFLGVSSVP